MPFTLPEIIYGGIVPVAVACTLIVVLRRFLPSDLGERYTASVVLCSGFLVGYGLLSLGPWAPTAHWHWLPYTLATAAIVGPIACAEGIKSFERPLLYLFAALVAGWFLVPTWEDLTPSRTIHIIVLAAYVVLLASLLERLAKRTKGPLLPFVLWATMTATAVVLALSGSLRFALIALAGAGALFGIMLVACLKRETSQLRGIALVFSTMTVGALLVGRVNSFSEVPLVSYLLVPAAPLFVWSTALGPLSRMTGVKSSLLTVLLPFVVLGLAVALAVSAETSGGGEY